MNPKISVIICSKNRSKSLVQAIKSVAQSSYQGPWEIIVVDNASTDDTAAAAALALEDFPAPSKILYESKPGNGHGRNTAIEVASGEIAFFTDDDCLVDPNALIELAREFSNPSVGFVAGRINLYNPLDHLCCYFYASKPILFKAPWFLRPGYVQGSNMAFRMAALKSEAGAFDPVFGAGARFAGEDLELAMRCLLAGWEGRYSPRVVVRHDHGRSAATYAKLEAFYDEGVGAYIEKLQSDKRCGPLTRISIAAYLARLGWRSRTSLMRVQSGRRLYASTVKR